MSSGRKARALLDGMPKTKRSVTVGKYKLEPDACYEAACCETMLEDYDASGTELVDNLLYEAISVQHGWYNRAKTDFRLGRLDQRQWENLDKRLKEPYIIGGKEDQA